MISTLKKAKKALMLHLWLNRSEWPGSLNQMYIVGEISKQGIHKYMYRYNRHAEEQANLILIIRQIRMDHPTMCCRYMYYKINPVYMGRDRFEALCRAHGFTAKTKRSKKRTTDSSGVKRFDNLLEGTQLHSQDQAWSSDITFFEIDNSYFYITFIIDCFTRRILGSHVSNRLLTEQTTLPALKRAIQVRKRKIPIGLIFHSDGGGQYYESKFLDLTGRYEMKNSMCETAYENGIAERINGVIKNNYLKHWEIKTLSQLTKSVDRAVRLYNEDKPHSSLDKLAPVEFEKKLLKFNQQKLSTEKDSVDASR